MPVNAESLISLGNLAGVKGLWENAMLWEPVKEIENTVLTSKVFQCYLGGLLTSTIKFFKDNL